MLIDGQKAMDIKSVLSLSAIGSAVFTLRDGDEVRSLRIGGSLVSVEEQWNTGKFTLEVWVEDVILLQTQLWPKK